MAKKRDVLIGKLRDSDKLPTFEKYDQGSYALHLGVEPINDREYDIDVGLRFNENMCDYEPMELKEIICDILKDHTEYGSKIKKPCVTVTYQEDGEPSYHVDIVVYTYGDKNATDSQMYLARGKDKDSDETYWEKSDPVGIVNYVNDAVEKGETLDQFRRCVRYLKRWKHKRFNSAGHSEPASIGITLIAADYFSDCNNYEANNDLCALKKLVDKMLSLFETEEYDFQSSRWLYRLKYPMPDSLKFESETDAFSKMTNIQMTDFKERLDKLCRDLDEVEKEPDEIEQCKKLQKIFGEDFNIPEAKKVSKTQNNYIPASSASGGSKWLI